MFFFSTSSSALWWNTFPAGSPLLSWTFSPHLTPRLIHTGRLYNNSPSVWRWSNFTWLTCFMGLDLGRRTSETIRWWLKNPFEHQPTRSQNPGYQRWCFRVGKLQLQMDPTWWLRRGHSHAQCRACAMGQWKSLVHTVIRGSKLSCFCCLQPTSCRVPLGISVTVISLLSGPSANQLSVLQVTPWMGRKNWIPLWGPQATSHLRGIETFISRLPDADAQASAAIIL